jgi:hypothetical protein
MSDKINTIIQKPTFPDDTEQHTKHFKTDG